MSKEEIPEYKGKSVEPLYDAIDCQDCGEDAGNMEWDEDHECYICPNCGEVQ
jgi:Zn finger protein HypA/HybF involved in hydrogenase expression